MSAWHEALRLVRVSLVARLWIGTLVLAVLAVLWLQVPDSHIWQFAFSILFACVLLAAFFWFYSGIFRSLLKSGEERRPWFNWILLVAVIVVWWLLQVPIDKLAERRELYAGYWTSQLPHELRWLRTYEHLILLQNGILFLLRLIVAGLLLPAAVVVGAGWLRNGVGRIFRAWARWWYWVAAIVCGWIAFTASDKLMDWAPGHSVAGEMLSLLVRLGFVFTLDVLLACFVFAVAVVALRRDAVPPTE